MTKLKWRRDSPREWSALPNFRIWTHGNATSPEYVAQVGDSPWLGEHHNLIEAKLACQEIADEALTRQVQQTPCVVAQKESDDVRGGAEAQPIGPCWYAHAHSDACHDKTKGSGGGIYGNIFPACRKHHSEQESMPNRDFNKKYGTNIKAACRGAVRVYEKGEIGF